MTNLTRAPIVALSEADKIVGTQDGETVRFKYSDMKQDILGDQDNLQDQVNERVQYFQNLKAAKDSDLPVGRVVSTAGSESAADGGGQFYYVAVAGSGGIVMENGNELVSLGASLYVLPVDDVSQLAGQSGAYDGQQVSLAGWHPSSTVGGGTLVWNPTRAKSDHNGGTVFSPTVPWTTTTADYLNAVGETDPAGLGVWERLSSNVILVDWFGAKADFTTDDTFSIQYAINEAQDLVVDRFKTGSTVIFGTGGYLITSTITVTSSNIWIRGVDWSSSSLYAPNAAFDLFHFDGSALALYGCGMTSLRFDTPGNATGTQLLTTRLIDATFSYLYFVGHYDGLQCDGCARTYFTNVIFTQNTRTSGTSPRYAMDFRSYVGNNNSDVHVSTYQIFYPLDRDFKYSVSIRGADGIYFDNGHHQGGVIVQPDGEGLVTCASVFWSEVYMDTADEENFIFTGSSTAYRNFQFNGVYLRGSKRGMVVNTTSLVEKIKFSGGEISGHTRNGVEFQNANSNRFKFVGTDFDGNNSDNVIGDADIIMRGESHIISACNFGGGTANGTALNLATASTNCTIGDSDFNKSTQGAMLTDNGSGNKIGVLNGVSYKNKGSATILQSTTSITVTHGVDKMPPNDSIQVTPRTSLSGGGDFWTSNVTSTTFDINVSSAVSNNVVFSWSVDLTGV